MGNQMKPTGWRCAAAFAIAALTITRANGQSSSSANPSPATPAAGVELWTSGDSDRTDVLKLIGRALWRFEGRERYSGVAIERAWFTPQGERTRTQTRVYLDAADRLGAKWKWSARIGTNGSNVLGSATLRTTDWSKEVFVERELVETRQGLDKHIYYTFAGASMDLPASDHTTFNGMVGVQEFSGRNVRLHARGTLVHVLKPKLGLSFQLRTRYYHSTVPGEFDYFSPRDFVQLVPVVQVRRFDRGGWMYLAAFGYGAQKAAGVGWQRARLADLRIESPGASRTLHAFAQLQYANSSLTGGAGGYHYVLARAGLTAKLR
jgi:hypothetical protein